MPGPESGADVKNFRAGVFDRAAADYDRIGDPVLARMGRRLVELVGLEDGQAVLDVATGRGAVLFPAADAVGERGRAVGIDLAPRMVELTARDAEGRALGQIEVRVSDAEDLRDFADGEFDAVTCAFAVFFLPHPERAVREFARVVRPGGTVALSSWGSPDATYAWFGEVREELGIARVETETEPFETTTELAGALEAVGLVDVAAASEPVVFRPGGPEDWWRWLMTGASRATIESLAPAEQRRFRDACFERIREVYADGRVELRVDALFAIAKRPERS